MSSLTDQREVEAPPSLQEAAQGRRARLVLLVLASVWLAAAALTLGVRSLGGDEARLLDSEELTLLPELTLRAVAALGPPAELIPRLLGLLALGLAAIAGRRLLRLAAFDLRSERQAGAFVTLALLCQGTLLIEATRLGPTSLLLGGSAWLVISAIDAGLAPRPSAWRAVALALSSALALAADPLSFILIAGLALWLARRRRRTAAATLLISAGVLLILVALAAPSPLGDVQVPSLTAVAGALVGRAQIPAQEGAGFLQTFTQAQALLLIGLALLGPGRLPRELLSLCALLAVWAGALLLTRGLAVAGGLLAPPVLVLAALRLAALERGPDRAVWLALFVGGSVASGLTALASSPGGDLGAVAAALRPDERLVASDEGDLRAVEYYRRGSLGRRPRVARLWRPGDREPRPVVALALGDPVGGLLLLRPARLAFDLGQHLPEARVTYRERGVTYACRWREEQLRFSCDGPNYQVVMWSYSTFAGAEGDAILAPPLDDGMLELRWDDVPLGRRLVGVAGLDDSSLSFARSPVTLEVRSGARPPLVLRRGDEPGLIPFELRNDGAERGAVTLRLTTPDDRGRNLFFDLVTVR